MQVNRTASYSPSYTANYGEVQQSKSKSATKLTYSPHQEADQNSKPTPQQIRVANKLAQKVVGQILNAKA